MLGDPADDDFKHQCLHDHTVKCESCTDLTNALQFVEEKSNDLSSSMYNKEQHEDLRYDFNKSVKSIKEWECHILHSQNQEKAK